MNNEQAIIVDYVNGFGDLDARVQVTVRKDIFFYVEVVVLPPVFKNTCARRHKNLGRKTQY